MGATHEQKTNRWLARRYGSRSGFARTWAHRLRALFGGYRRYRGFDRHAIERLVFVCKGNICRSAYAESVAKSMGLASVSCGLDTQDGHPANVVAQRIAALNGHDLSRHQTTAIDSLSPRKGDLLIAMEPWQAARLRAAYPDIACTLLGLWVSPMTPHIEDPYGASDAYFQRCFALIERGVGRLAAGCTQARKQ